MSAVKFLKPVERSARIEEKRRKILRFLRDEIYTTREITQAILDLAPTPAKMTLAAMCRDDLIRMERVSCAKGINRFLYGITPHGQAMAFDPDAGEKPNAKVFEPGRVGLTTLAHFLQIQMMRVKAEKAGFTDWIIGDRGAMFEKNQCRTDAIVTSNTGEKLGIEVELTIKTIKRYEVVILDRLKQIKSRIFERVVWITKDEDIKKRLESMLKSIDKVTFEHSGKLQTVTITDEHKARLCFTTLDKFPTF